jgi:hypothetical protein
MSVSSDYTEQGTANDAGDSDCGMTQGSNVAKENHEKFQRVSGSRFEYETSRIRSIW